jgi:HPt (histidine-containing phosphotransfer) domain-containing protein
LSGSEVRIFDAQFAINQFSGNKSLLVQILQKFIQQYQYFDTLFSELLQQEDLRSAKQQLHTLKGVSGNLGMKTLHQACKDLEEELANQETENGLKEFLQVFKQTLTLIQDFSSKNGTQETPETAPQQGKRAELIAVLKRNEFISESKIQGYGQSLDLSSEELNKLKRAIDNLDYITAIALLEY